MPETALFYQGAVHIDTVGAAQIPDADIEYFGQIGIGRHRYHCMLATDDRIIQLQTVAMVTADGEFTHAEVDFRDYRAVNNMF